jgi:transcriptional regulator with XRE-family HTH domain
MEPLLEAAFLEMVVAGTPLHDKRGDLRQERLFMVEHVARGSKSTPDGSTVWKLVGRRLHARRTELGLAVDLVADEINTAPTVYESYEAGDAQTPAELLAEMARLFGVPVLWFFQDVVSQAEIAGDREADLEGPHVYRIATVEQRLHFLTESFCKLDLEGQQYLLAIVGALTQFKSTGIGNYARDDQA